jgi:predicted ATPase
VIEQLELRNFKAFASLTVPLGGYTLLSGLNSSGKSTVLQSLALLRQAVESSDGNIHDLSGIPLNGNLVELGTGQDVLYDGEERSEPEITIALLYEGGHRLECRIGYGANDDYLPVIDVAANADVGSLSLFCPGFQYLRADRIGPAVAYPRSEHMSVRRDFLRSHQDEPVPVGPLRRGDAGPRLLDQVTGWLSEICPGVRIETTAIEHTDLVRLGFQFVQPRKLTSRARRPTNVGFGLTYVLPIIIACVTATPGSMILLENPEAHVHPRGQSAMARMTCGAAAAGAQVIVETHSDHILNGVRLAVKNEGIPARDVALHYFDRQEDGIRVLSPTIGPDGMLSEWPPGFFDEWDRSLDQLLD